MVVVVFNVVVGINISNIKLILIMIGKSYKRITFLQHAMGIMTPEGTYENI